MVRLEEQEKRVRGLLRFEFVVRFCQVGCGLISFSVVSVSFVGWRI